MHFKSSNPRIWLGFNGQTVYSDLCAWEIQSTWKTSKVVVVVVVVVDVEFVLRKKLYRRINSINSGCQKEGGRLKHGVFIGSKLLSTSGSVLLFMECWKLWLVGWLVGWLVVTSWKL